MERDADINFPSNNLAFVKEAIKAECRVDGRSLYETRPVRIELLPDDSGATVALGDTRMHAAISAELEQPRGSADGRLAIDVKFSPMASTAFSNSNRMDRQATEIAQLLQRVVADAAAVDLEALTVQRGRMAWVLRLDIHVLSHCGNLIDCALLAAISSLCAFRLPQTEISSTGTVVVFTPEEREPLPLTVQHVPLAVSFALFAGGDITAADATREEDAAAEGGITLVATEHGELCGIHKVAGCAVSPDVIMRCVRLSAGCIGEAAKHLREALRVHEIARVHSRVRRVGGGGAVAVGSTAAAAEEVRAARERIAPPARGVAVFERQEVSVPAAVPAAELPELGTLAVEQPMADEDEGAGARATRAAAEAAESLSGDARRASNDAIEASTGGGEGEEQHVGVGVRLQPPEPQNAGEEDLGEGEKAAGGRGARGTGRKKGGVGGSRKRCSPGAGNDDFEELAARIGAPPPGGHGAPTLAASVRTPQKKARGAGKGRRTGEST